MFHRSFLAVFAVTTLLLFFAGCVLGQSKSQPRALSLADARRGFTTHLLVHNKATDAVVRPPAGFQLVHYPAPLGNFPAYLTTTRDHTVRHPAIVWLVGGFDNSIGDTPWRPATPDNDQSARAFPKAGIITLYPSLRGGNNNPGDNEGFYGEVDDVIAAAKYLAHRPDVDSTRIYLGGHSTGGTLALLTAESTRYFRAVFAFGPVALIQEYGSDVLPFDTSDRRETALRSPLLFLGAIVSPTFVFEGTKSPSNIAPLRVLYAHCHNVHVHIYEVPNLDHFSELASMTPVIAHAIVKDTGRQPHFSF